MAADFTHLHTHSHFSLLQATPKIPELIKLAKDSGMSSLALTDAGNLYGAIEFYKTAKANDIKPIIGADLYVAARTRHDREAEEDRRSFRLVLLAINEDGYKNLMRLISESFLSGFYYRPRIDHELLEKYSNNLIAILPSFAGEIAIHVRNGRTDKAKEVLSFYRQILGNENVFQEITIHDEINGHNDLQKKIVSFCSENDLPIVAAHDVYYLKPEDRKVRDV